MSKLEVISGPPTVPKKRGLGKITMVFAAGAALFSDGYLNGSTGEINFILGKLYPVDYPKNNHSQLFSSMNFAGIVIGMLSFGWIADKVGRKSGMLLATAIIIVFTILCAGAYGAHGSTTGMLQALIAYRFLAGIGIGAEYPAGSVACSENTEEPTIKPGTQHFLFAMATNVMIDFGFVFATLTPLVLVKIFGEDHLRIVWRGTFALGTVIPIILMFFRLKMTETTRFIQSGMRDAPTPYWLIIKRYWKSFTGLAIAWFVYDFIAYPFGIYSTPIVNIITGGKSDIVTVFSWNTVINCFYLPGCIGGAFLVDRVKPKRLMISMLLLQALFGFFMSGFYVQLQRHIAGFTIMYGLFLCFGEAGPGNCLGLLASKSWPSAIRGRAYGLAAAIGKIGAYVGTWAFPAIIDDFPAGPKQSSGPFWIGSGMAIFSALCVFFLVPEVENGHMTNEDIAFKEYLEANGYDTSLMGIQGVNDSEASLDKKGAMATEKEVTGY